MAMREDHLVISEEEGITISSSPDDKNFDSLSNNQQYTGYSEDEQHPVIIVLSSSEGKFSSDSDVDNLMDPISGSVPDTAFTSGHKQKSRAPSPTPIEISEPITVMKVPFDIDGNIVYRLPYNTKEKMKSSLDGRPWKTWVTSSRKGFAGVRRRANCKGSYKCYNIHCSYNKQYNIVNRTQFEKEGEETVCKCCGVRAIHIDCPAVKVWEFPSNSHLVTIMHAGNHTCVAIPRQDSSKLETVFNENPDLRPRQAACKLAVNAIKAGKSWEEVIKITDTFINTNKVRNVKQKVRKSMHPSGVNFEAVGQLKSKVDDQDPYYIYRVNDRKLNQQKSYVFKTSRTQANIVLSMDRHREGILNKEYCFMDVKHNRCSGFKTFSVHVYHPLLRKVITLATMECEDETTDTFTKFWILLNEVLQKVSSDPKRIFNPFGWMADEAGANWAALAKVFGQDVLNRTIGCQFHLNKV